MCTFKNLEEIKKTGKKFEKTSGNLVNTQNTCVLFINISVFQNNFYCSKYYLRIVLLASSKYCFILI